MRLQRGSQGRSRDRKRARARSSSALHVCNTPVAAAGHRTRTERLFTTQRLPSHPGRRDAWPLQCGADHRKFVALHGEARSQLRSRRAGWRHRAEPTVRGPRSVAQTQGGDDDARVELTLDAGERRRSHGWPDRIGCGERKYDHTREAIGPCLDDGLGEERTGWKDKASSR